MKKTFWRAALAPFGVPAEVDASPMLAVNATIRADLPLPLRAVVDGLIEVIGSVDLFTRDAGRDPVLLLAAGVVHAEQGIVDRLAGGRAQASFELADLDFRTGVVNGGRLMAVTVQIPPEGVNYSAWPSVTRFELSPTPVLLDDLLGAG